MNLIKRLIQEAVEEELYKRGLITEMAFKRKEYKKRIDDLFPQVIENLALVTERTLTGVDLCKTHWSQELRGHLFTITRFNLKDESERKRFDVLCEIIRENDYYDPKVIKMVILNKFMVEKIDIADTPLMREICEKVIEDIKVLIELISNKDIDAICKFVDCL